MNNKQTNNKTNKQIKKLTNKFEYNYHVIIMHLSYNDYWLIIWISCKYDKNSSTVGLLVIKNNQINKQTNNWKTNQHQTNRKQTNTEIQIWWSYDYHAIIIRWSPLVLMMIIWLSLPIGSYQELVCQSSTSCCNQGTMYQSSSSKSSFFQILRTV